MATSQELGPILYRSWEGVCSVSVENTAKPLCTTLHYQDLSWQPHGNRIVAVGPGGLVLLDSKGRLTSKAEGQSAGRPTWSPDGQYIYAISGTVGGYVLRWNSTGKNRVIIPVIGVGDPRPYFQMISLSPSGKRAAILTLGFKSMLISDVSDKAWTATKILPRGFNYVAQSAWLDDEHLLFVGKQDSTRGELWELDLQSESITRRGIDGLWLRDFVTLSPDAKSVVVTGTKDGEDASWNLWQYSLETSRLTRLTSGLRSEDVGPSWRHR
jgi:Tol biopolymer transport system component